MFVQIKFSEVILQMDSEVHVLNRMNDDVNELHTGHLTTITMATTQINLATMYKSDDVIQILTGGLYSGTGFRHKIKFTAINRFFGGVNSMKL